MQVDVVWVFRASPDAFCGQRLDEEPDGPHGHGDRQARGARAGERDWLPASQTGVAEHQPHADAVSGRVQKLRSSLV